MNNLKSFSVGLAVLLGAGSKAAVTSEKIGVRARALTAELVAFGPRPPGSAGLEKVRKWISKQVGRHQLIVREDAFMARTPVGEIAMKNLSFIVPGTNHSKKVVLMAHYDSKRFTDFKFVGANDSASSVGLLLAMVPEISKRNLSFDTEIVFVDGEEALLDWTDKDSLYGSRRFVANLTSSSSIRAAVVLDMIGDADLKLVNNSLSDLNLRLKMKNALTELGHANLMEVTPTFVEDDHLPLIQAGIPTLHVMDFTYGSQQTPGKYWHTAQDTLDKVSPRSLAIVSDVVLKILEGVNAR